MGLRRLVSQPFRLRVVATLTQGVALGWAIPVLRTNSGSLRMSCERVEVALEYLNFKPFTAIQHLYCIRLTTTVKGQRCHLSAILVSL